MKVIDPTTIPSGEMYQYLVSTINPRPIAFVSTLANDGVPNLAPYSFFNCFSSNPPILAFSPIRRGGSHPEKDTLANLMETGELVINTVPFSMARQMALTSIQFPRGVDEFQKSGLTPIPSERVKPFRVKESPVHFECAVQKIIPLGDSGGSGNLVICRVLLLHIHEEAFDDLGNISPHKLDHLGRLGRAYYVRASEEAVYKIYQPQNEMVIGYENLPPSARASSVLTGNNLGQLAGISVQPSAEDIHALRNQDRIRKILLGSPTPREELHRYAQMELAKENTALAAQIVWLAEEVNQNQENHS